MNKRIMILLVMLMMSHIAHSENDGNATISLMTELSPVLNKTFLGPNPAVIMQKGSPQNQDLVSYTLRGEGKSLRVWQDADGLILKIPMTDSVLRSNTRMDETFMISRLLEVLDEKFTFSRSKLSGDKENEAGEKLIIESQGTVSEGSFLVYRPYRARGEWMKWEKVGILISG